jgi:PKD repeat protein
VQRPLVSPARAPERQTTRRWRRLELAAIAAFLLGALALYVHLERQPAPLASRAQGSLRAVASAMPNQGWVPLKVHFGAFGSADPGGQALRYEWDLDGNGLYDTDATTVGGYATYTYLKPGQYTVTLQVTSPDGRVATDQVSIDARHPASSNVDYWAVFDDSRVRRVDISLTQADWDLMWSDPEAKITVPADAVVFGERLRNVGLRMRGQFSLRESRSKKPWKIDTDAFVDGKEFHNLRQLMFINNIGDPTMLMEKLSYDMMAFAGVPAGHVAFVELWFDIVDDGGPPLFWGVYSMVERVDKKLVGNRFGQDAKEGNLYKASHAQRGPMDLVYYGERIEDYPTQNGQYAYGLVSGSEPAGYQDIVDLCRVVDGTAYETPEEWAQALEEVLNVDGFLRYLAVVVTTMNWDTYPNTGNNYYLFHNPVAGRFEWIPWDLTWGDNPSYSLYQWQGQGLVERAPLTDRIFEVERYRLRYRAYLDLLTRYYFNRESIAERAQAYHDLIAPYVRQSTGDRMYFGPDAMFPIEQFDEGWQRLAEVAGNRSRFIRQDLEQGP